MSTYTIDELRALVNELGFDDNAKIILLVGQTEDGKYAVVKVNDAGELVVAS